MLGDDSAAYATVVIGSHHRAAIFAASPPGSIQAVSAPVTTHQVVGVTGGGDKRRQRQYERGEGTTGSC